MCQRRSRSKRLSAAGATHLLRAELSRDGESIVLEASLNDVQKRVVTRRWQARYAAADLRYAPVGLAGMVTAAFGLPPVAANANRSFTMRSSPEW